MNFIRRTARATALAVICCLLITSFAACTLVLPGGSASDPIASIPQDDPAYRYGALPQGVSGEDVVYPVYDASTMEYTLERIDLKPFHRTLAACEELYQNGSLEDEERLLSMLYEVVSYKEYYSSQYSVAYMRFCTDTADPVAIQNRQDAYKYMKDASGDFWEFVAAAEKNKTPLYDTVEYFVDLVYPDTITRKSGAAQYDQQLETLKTEFSSLPSDTPHQSVLPLYLEFLKVGSDLAELCGYENYYEYEVKLTYKRPYTKEQRQALREYVRTYVVPAFREYDKRSDRLDEALSLIDYQRTLSYSGDDFRTVGDGVLFDYFDALPVSIGARMKSAFVYDRILYGASESSHPTAFVQEVGNIPMIYFPTERVSLPSGSHELGHYCQHLAEPEICFSYEMREFYADSNTMLLISYLADKLDPQAYEAFRVYEIKIVLFEIIMHTIRDEFDEIVLSMEDTDSLTVEDLQAIMQDLIDRYDAHGMTENSDTQLLNYWRMYAILSSGYFGNYTTSGLAALELYRLSVEDFDRAAELYRVLMEDAARDGQLLSTTQKHGWETLLDDILS